MALPTTQSLPTPKTVIAGNISLVWENSERYGEMFMPFPHDYVYLSLTTLF
jgi:hypothetical protein